MTDSFDKIALVVGAGAVENAWAPIIKVLQTDHDFDIDADCANSIFARYVYLMRFYSTGTFSDAQELLQEVVKDVTELKHKISEELLNAEKNGRIKAHKEFEEILYKFVFSEIHKSVLISTNWDTVIDNEINILGKSNYPTTGSNIETIHLHGSISSPKNLYLPSEITKESYRTKEEDSEIGTNHQTIMSLIEDSNKTILYGLSLDPLDAELCQSLAAGWASPNLKEIIIINPDHKKVAKRVKLLMDSRYKIEISGYSPDNLIAKVSY